MDFDNNATLADPPRYVLLRGTNSRYRADIWSLVLLSAGIPHSSRVGAGEYQIVVHHDHFPAAEGEISRFEEENLNWPPPPLYQERLERVSAGYNPPTVMIIGALLIFYSITGAASHANEWFKVGAVNSRAMIYGGEWWRALTALTLHADSVHLLGNLFIGGFVIHFLCRNFGTGLGWFLVMLSGAAGNVLNVLARGSGHLSVGFSTAVFGAVGILCGSRISRSRHGWLKGFLLPLGAGCALLAMLGSSGRRTDLGAHLWGLISGLVLGALAEFIPIPLTERMRKYRQALFFVITVSVVYIAWQQAFLN